MDHLCYFCLVLLCFHARLFVDALWSPAGKGLISWLTFLMSCCDVVSFPLITSSNSGGAESPSAMAGIEISSCDGVVLDCIYS